MTRMHRWSMMIYGSQQTEFMETNVEYVLIQMVFIHDQNCACWLPSTVSDRHSDEKCPVHWQLTIEDLNDIIIIAMALIGGLLVLSIIYPPLIFLSIPPTRLPLPFSNEVINFKTNLIKLLMENEPSVVVQIGLLFIINSLWLLVPHGGTFLWNGCLITTKPLQKPVILLI